ncbi:hypothetical protein C8R44DRAFT_435839 [Mycena epipterygia]|nr:hypothetical protein C8R44DRAFT_435839 [Mycena epipterygia]
MPTHVPCRLIWSEGGSLVILYATPIDTDTALDIARDVRSINCTDPDDVRGYPVVAVVTDKQQITLQLDWRHADWSEARYRALVAWFQALGESVAVFCCRPIVAETIWDTVQRHAAEARRAVDGGGSVLPNIQEGGGPPTGPAITNTTSNKDDVLPKNSVASISSASKEPQPQLDSDLNSQNHDVMHPCRSSSCQHALSSTLPTGFPPNPTPTSMAREDRRGTSTLHVPPTNMRDASQNQSWKKPPSKIESNGNTVRAVNPYHPSRTKDTLNNDRNNPAAQQTLISYASTSRSGSPPAKRAKHDSNVHKMVPESSNIDLPRRKPGQSDDTRTPTNPASTSQQIGYSHHKPHMIPDGEETKLLRAAYAAEKAKEDSEPFGDIGVIHAGLVAQQMSLAPVSSEDRRAIFRLHRPPTTSLIAQQMSLAPVSSEDRRAISGLHEPPTNLRDASQNPRRKHPRR